MGKPRNTENTRHTRKYPKDPEIPESKKDTRKYPIVYFDTPTRSKPDPLPGILSNTRPDPTRFWKTLPAGHWSQKMRFVVRHLWRYFNKKQKMMPTMLQTLTSMILLAAMRTLSALKQCNRSSSKHPKYDKEIKREWGNVEDESLSISSPFLLLSISSSFPPSLSISSFSLHFLFISSFSLHILAARLQRVAQPWLHLIAQCLSVKALFSTLHSKMFLSSVR